MVLALLMTGCLHANDAANIESHDFSGIMTHQGAPEAATDWSIAPFSDQGAWFGFALPPAQRQDLRGGFSGPFLMSEGHWLSRQLIAIELRLADSDEQIPLSNASEHTLSSLPGMLQESMTVEGLSVKQTLWFDRESAMHVGMALIQLDVENLTAKEQAIVINWSGSVFGEQQALVAGQNNLLVRGNSGYRLRIGFEPESIDLVVDGHSYQANARQTQKIAPGESITATITIDLSLENDPQIPLASIDTRRSDAARSLTENRERWHQWLTKVDPGPQASEALRVIAVKSLQTLVNNWRGPAGRLSHHGMFPSHNVWYFNGYWAWDTWKQAVGVLEFDADLAKALVRGMFERQHT